MKANRILVLHIGKLSAALGITLLLVFLGAWKVSAADNNDSAYLIKVNRYHNTITVYTKDETGGVEVPVKAFLCSVGQKGTETVLGTYQTQAKYRWKELMGDVWGQYSTRIVGGILFHSVYYYEDKNPGTLAVSEYNKLGSSASHGCIRLTVVAAKWIYDNCPVGTTVIIYDDKDSPGPLGKPEAIKLPKSVRWDPTDPNNQNPYKDKMPSIIGVKDKAVSWGTEIDLRDGITARSSIGSDITSQIIMEGTIDFYKSGKYKITYSVTDALGRTAEKTINVRVKRPDIPEIYGVEDHVVPKGTIITRDYVMDGVTASGNGITFEEDEIDVTIDKMGEDVYLATYSISVNGDVYGTASAYYVLDGEAPVFTGISDRMLEPDQIPDITLVTSGVSVIDNYSGIDAEDIIVTIEEIPWDEAIAFRVTYEATDGVGNSTKETAIFYY